MCRETERGTRRDAMPTKVFKVLVIGAGLAGLTPAQGRLWQGVVVEVLERDTPP
jgi:phytoene dehydrogenase-like protein